MDSIFVLTEEHKNYNQIYIKSDKDLVKIFRELRQQAEQYYIATGTSSRTYKFHNEEYAPEEIIYELTIKKINVEDFTGYCIID